MIQNRVVFVDVFFGYLFSPITVNSYTIFQK